MGSGVAPKASAAGANGLNTAGGRYWWWGGAEDRNALVLAAGVDKAENRRTLLVGGM